MLWFILCMSCVDKRQNGAAVIDDVNERGDGKITITWLVAEAVGGRKSYVLTRVAH